MLLKNLKKHKKHMLFYPMKIKGVNMIEADGIAITANGHDVEALAGLEVHMPIVFRHAGDDVVVSEGPAGTDITVLYPNIGIFLREGHLGDGVLHEDTGVRLAVVVHDLPLVGNHVL